nr:hypothetical protein [Tanacetum cinerariifolium]
QEITVLLAWVMGGDPRREEGAKHDDQHECQTGHGAFVLREVLPELFVDRRVEQALIDCYYGSSCAHKKDLSADDECDAVLHDRVVAGADGFDQPLADARPGEDRLGQNRTGQQCADLQAEHGQNRDQRVAQAVNEHHARRRQAFGTGGPHVVFTQDFEHRGACHPGDDRQRNGAQHDGRQDQVTQGVHERAFFIAEQGVDQHETGSGRNVVQQRCREQRSEFGPHARARTQRFAQVAMGEFADVIDVLRIKGFVQAKTFHGLGVHFRIDPAFTHHDFHRVARNQTDQCEGQQGDAEEGGARRILLLLHLGGSEVISGERADVVTLHVVAHCSEHLGVSHADPGQILIEDCLGLLIERGTFGRLVDLEVGIFLDAGDVVRLGVERDLALVGLEFLQAHVVIRGDGEDQRLTLEAPDHVIGVHVAGWFEVFGGVELDALAQVERIGQTVIADFPGVGQRGNDLGRARLEVHQTVIDGFRRSISGHGRGVERRVETFRTGFSADHQRLGRNADCDAEQRHGDCATQCCEFECRFQVTHSASDEAIDESVSGYLTELVDVAISLVFARAVGGVRSTHGRRLERAGLQGVRSADTIFVVVLVVHLRDVVGGAFVVRAVDVETASLVNVELQAWHAVVRHVQQVAQLDRLLVRAVEVREQGVGQEDGVGVMQVVEVSIAFNFLVRDAEAVRFVSGGQRQAVGVVVDFTHLLLAGIFGLVVVQVGAQTQHVGVTHFMGEGEVVLMPEVFNIGGIEAGGQAFEWLVIDACHVNVIGSGGVVGVFGAELGQALLGTRRHAIKAAGLDRDVVELITLNAHTFKA